MEIKKVFRWIAFACFAFFAYSTFLRWKALRPEPLKKAEAFVRYYASENLTFGELGFSPDITFVAADWIDRFFAPQTIASFAYEETEGGLPVAGPKWPKDVVMLKNSLDGDKDKKEFHKNVPYQLVIRGEGADRDLILMGYKHWEEQPIWVTKVKLPKSESMLVKAPSPPEEKPLPEDAYYGTASAAVHFNVTLENGSNPSENPDALELALKKILTFEDWGRREVMDYQGTLKIGGVIQAQYFKIITEGNTRQVLDLMKDKGETIRLSPENRLKLDPASLKSRGAVFKGQKEIAGFVCQIWEEPSGMTYCLWKLIPVEIREPLKGRILVHTVIDVLENSKIDPNIFAVPSQLKLEDRASSPSSLLSGSGSLTRQFLEAKIKTSGDIPEKIREPKKSEAPREFSNYHERWEWSIEPEIRALAGLVAALTGKANDPSEILRGMKNYKRPAITLEVFELLKAPMGYQEVHKEIVTLLKEHVALMQVYDQGDLKTARVQAETLYPKYQALQSKYKALKALWQ